MTLLLSPERHKPRTDDQVNALLRDNGYSGVVGENVKDNLMTVRICSLQAVLDGLEDLQRTIKNLTAAR